MIVAYNNPINASNKTNEISRARPFLTPTLIMMSIRHKTRVEKGIVPKYNVFLVCKPQKIATLINFYLILSLFIRLDKFLSDFSTWHSNFTQNFMFYSSSFTLFEHLRTYETHDKPSASVTHKYVMIINLNNVNNEVCLVTRCFCYTVCFVVMQSLPNCL